MNTSIKLDSWPAGSDKRKEVFEPGKKDDVHFGVPVVITWLFGVLKPRFPQSKPLMCFQTQLIWGMADHNEIAVRLVQFRVENCTKYNLFPK